ncbi:MAG: hypothetical protein K6A14_02865, partial [Erysipelotrichaceae bacterium]|nr:hypothetical protein [Erysipelotrichaceae bacterium]
MAVEYRPLKSLVLNGARLLKKEEFEMYRHLIPETERAWFLDSSVNAEKRDYYDAVTVYQHHISFGSKQGCYGYRPAIELCPESHELKPGARFALKSREFTVLRCDLALCTTSFMASVYDTRTVDYQKSIIKKRIDKWYRELVS